MMLTLPGFDILFSHLGDPIVARTIGPIQIANKISFFAPPASLKYCPTVSIPDRPTSRTGKAIVERKRAIDYGHCRIGVASTATAIRSTEFRQFTGMTPRVGAIELNNLAFVKYAV